MRSATGSIRGSVARVRRARPADLPALARVALGAWRATFVAIVPPVVVAARSLADFRRRFAASLAQVRVVEWRGRIAGFTLVTDGHIDMLFVDLHAQGRGLGRALLADAERRGARSLESFARNRAARAFYAAAGWRVTRSYRRVFLRARLSFVRMERAPATRPETR